MIALYQFARSWDIPNQSQFCVKVETYLRMAKLPYETIPTLPFKAPLGKLPYIEDHGKSARIADSRLILHYLESAYSVTLDAHLDAATKSVAKALQRLIEEHLYWASMYARWRYTEQNWQSTKRAIFGVLPPVVRDIGAFVYYRRIGSQILGHGLGRLTPDRVFDLGGEDLDALASFLGEKPYFLGDRPTALDATAYGFLVNIVAPPVESPLKERAIGHANLVEYCRRMQMEYFPEFPPQY